MAASQSPFDCQRLPTLIIAWLAACSLLSQCLTASTPSAAYPYPSQQQLSSQLYSVYSKPTSSLQPKSISSQTEYAILDSDVAQAASGAVKIYSYNNSLITTSASNLDIVSFLSSLLHRGEDEIMYAAALPRTKVILLYKNINSGQAILNLNVDIRSLQGMPYPVPVSKTSIMYFAMGNSTNKLCRLSPVNYDVQCGLEATTGINILNAHSIPGRDAIVTLHDNSTSMITVMLPALLGSPKAQIFAGGSSTISGMTQLNALLDNLDVSNYIVLFFGSVNGKSILALSKYCIESSGGCASPPFQMINPVMLTAISAAFFQNVGTFNIVLLTSDIITNTGTGTDVNVNLLLYRKTDLQYLQSIQISRTIGSEKRIMYCYQDFAQSSINLLSTFGFEFEVLTTGQFGKKYTSILNLEADPCAFLADGLLANWPTPTSSHFYPLQVHHCQQISVCTQSPPECELFLVSTLALSTSVTFTFSHPLHSSLLSPLALLPLTNTPSNLTSMPFTTFIYDTTLTIIFDTPLESYSLSFLSKYPTHIPLPVISADFKRMFQHNLTASYASYPTATDVLLNVTAAAAQTLTAVAPVVLVALSSAKVSGDTNFLMLSPTLAFILTKMQANFIYLYSFSGPNLVFPTYIMDRLRRSQSSHVLALQAKIDSLQPNRNCQTTLPNSLVKIGFHCQFLHSAGADTVFLAITFFATLLMTLPGALYFHCKNKRRSSEASPPEISPSPEHSLAVIRPPISTIPPHPPQLLRSPLPPV